MSVNALARSGSISHSTPSENKGFFSRMKRCCNSSALPLTLAVGGLTLGSVALVGAGILAVLGAAVLVTASVATLAIPLLIVGGVALIGGGVIMAIRAYQSRRARSEDPTPPVQATSSASEMSTTVTSGEGVDNKTFKPDDDDYKDNKAGSGSRKGNLNSQALVVEELITASAAPNLLHGNKEGNGSVN